MDNRVGETSKILLAALLLVSCGPDPSDLRPGDVRGEIGDGYAVLQTPGVSLHGEPIQVLGEAGGTPLVEGVIHFGSFRAPAPPRVDTVELRGLPPEWTSISAGGVTFLERGKGVQRPLPGDSKVSWWVALPFFFCMFVVVLLMGVSGGPIHGEEPITLTLIHLIAFFVMANSWASGPYYTYLGLLIVALVVSVFSAGIRIWSDPFSTWVARGVMTGLYVAMFILIKGGPEYESAAEWTGHDCIQIYVQKSMRDRIQLIDGNGEVLSEEKSDPDADRHILYFWTGEESPEAVRIGEETLSLDERPGS
ncbi:MAG: hypothetical protein O7H41_00915 [Planctomycetota bacterium]|nr:hypothetical protein [Planctomycetota bacterium]